MTVTDASSSKAPVSVVVPCFNEAAMIAECLGSVQFADEIFVVDSFSTDKTVEIARGLATRVVQHEFWSHGAQINWAVPQAKHPWILVVDADERVTPELAEEIRTILRAPRCHGYEMRRRNFFLGREIRHGTWGSDYPLRLYHRDKGRYQERHVHSRVVLDGRPARCRETLIHYTYRTLDDYARKIHRFSRGGALNANERGERGSMWKIFAHGGARFFKTYALKMGFLDGAEGLIIALMEADYAALKYAKLWELQRKKPDA